MSQEKLEKFYNPASIERKWYNHWMEKDYFSADPKSEKETYTIVIPTPNVTAKPFTGPEPIKNKIIEANNVVMLASKIAVLDLL